MYLQPADEFLFKMTIKRSLMQVQITKYTADRCFQDPLWEWWEKISENVPESYKRIFYVFFFKSSCFIFLISICCSSFHAYIKIFFIRVLLEHFLFPFKKMYIAEDFIYEKDGMELETIDSSARKGNYE